MLGTTPRSTQLRKQKTPRKRGFLIGATAPYSKPADPHPHFGQLQIVVPVRIQVLEAHF